MKKPTHSHHAPADAHETRQSSHETRPDSSQARPDTPKPLPNSHGPCPNSPDARNDVSLDALRARIDALDAELLSLLNRRAAVSVEVGKIKARDGSPVFRPEREAALLEKLQRQNPGPLPPEHLAAVYREILASSRALQRPVRVACLGPEGTFSHLAALEYLGHANTFIPMPSLEDVFAAVTKRECDLAVVPIENSLHGTVIQSLDCFHAHAVHIQAEWYGRINVNLLSNETETHAIRTVYSHPQPLGQCAAWLRANVPSAQQVSLASTTAAARKAAQEPFSAAIGDARQAGALGLRVLARNIEDFPDNWTRFFLIGASPLPRESAPERAPENAPENAPKNTADKSSVMFTLRDEPGSLSRVLNALAEAGINLSKLESRPLRGERWKYIFFADLDCDIAGPEHAGALEATDRLCLSFRILGSYTAGRYLHAAE